ncbi:glycosyltransferase [Clostridium botulinum]|nr:glycosyltransferase [Clostridium botulinum]
MNSIVAVIVTYNRKELLKQCIDALINQSIKKFDIMVIDNASTDNTYEEIKGLIESEKVIYINTGKNLGGAGGFNYGIKEAYLKGYKYYWIMDDDTIQNATSLEELLNADRILNGKWGFLSSSIYWENNEACIMNKQLVDKNCIDDLGYIENGIIKIKEATFVSCFIKREVVFNVGLPIKEFIIWNDDREYTDRISDKYNSYLVSKSKAVHKILNNIETDIENDTIDRMWRYKFVFRNGYYFTKRKGWKSKLRYHIKIFKRIKKVLNSNCNKKFLRIKIIIKSLISGYFFNPEIEYIVKK